MMDTRISISVQNSYSALIGLQEKDDPMSILMRTLVKSIAPPSLTALLQTFSSLEGWEDFITIVNEYIPEAREQILREATPKKQMEIFIDTFDKKYFPLARDWVLEQDDEEEGYNLLTNNVPVEVLGWQYDQYDELPSENEPFEQLLCYLLPNPEDENDERVALADACKNVVPEGILSKVPAKGFPFDKLHKMLDDTKYAFVAKFGDWLSANTGNYFLDTDDEDYWNGYHPDWAPETIEELTKNSKEVDQFFTESDEFQTWLEKDTVKHFQELLNFMLKKYKKERKEKHDDTADTHGRTLADVLTTENTERIRIQD